MTIQHRIMMATTISLAACGSDADMCPGKSIISIEYVHSTARIVFVRESNTDWVPLPLDPSGRTSFCAAESYDIASICHVSDVTGEYVVAEQFLATTAESTFRLTQCGIIPPQMTYQVSGMMTDTGSVTVADQRVSRNNSPWRFSVAVPPATHTLFASTMINSFDEGPQTYVVLPDLVVDRDVDVGSIDVTSGQRSEPLDVTVIGAEVGSRLSLRVSATFKDGSRVPVSISSASPAWVLPPSLQGRVEEERISVTANGDGFAYGVVRATAAGTEFRLPPRWSDAVLEQRDGRAVATLGSLPLVPYDRVSLGEGGDRDASFERVVATRTRIELQQLKTLAFDGTVPGYQRSFTSSTSSWLTAEHSSDSGEHRWTYISKQGGEAAHSMQLCHSPIAACD